MATSENWSAARQVHAQLCKALSLLRLSSHTRVHPTAKVQVKPKATVLGTF